MDSVGDLLGKYTPREPDEVGAIKQYVAEKFNTTVGVGIQGESLIITVRSGALANALRLRLPQLQAAANTKKRLVFRIG